MHRQVARAIIVAAEAARAEIKRQNKCNLTPEHLQSSFLAFWNQPMALASEEFFSAAGGVPITHAASTDAVDSYTYRDG